MAKYQYTVQGADYEVEITEIADNIANVTVNGVPFEVELKKALKPTARPIQQITAPAPKPAAAPAAPVAAPASPAATPGSGTKIEAPLPGTITEVKVNVGDKVKKGDTVVVLEAMKMQNNIEAENDGEVTSVLVKQGDSVMEGAPLVTIA
ncbi:MAG: biotin/lipoyl-containing protein [Prevotella sp.]